MIRILEQNIKKERINFLKSGLDKYLVVENLVRDYPKPQWFKGSRFR